MRARALPRVRAFVRAHAFIRVPAFVCAHEFLRVLTFLRVDACVRVFVSACLCIARIVVFHVLYMLAFYARVHASVRVCMRALI